MKRLLILSTEFFYTSSVIISLEFVFSNLRLAVSEDFALFAGPKESLSVRDLPQRYAPFHRDFCHCSQRGLPRSILRHWRRRHTRRQAFSFGVIDLSSECVKEHLTDCGVVVIHVFGEPLLGEPLLGHGLLIELDVSLCEEVVPWAHNLWGRSSCH